MSQTFEFYIVDPISWKDTTPLNQIKSCSISRDEETQTLGSATIDTTEVLDECYVRVYLVVGQNGSTEKVALGTFLVQTPSVSHDGNGHAADAGTVARERGDLQAVLSRLHEEGRTRPHS